MSSVTVDVLKAIEGDPQAVLKFYMEDSSFKDDNTNDSSGSE